MRITGNGMTLTWMVNPFHPFTAMRTSMDKGRGENEARM